MTHPRPLTENAVALSTQQVIMTIGTKLGGSRTSHSMLLRSNNLMIAAKTHGTESKPLQLWPPPTTPKDFLIFNETLLGAVSRRGIVHFCVSCGLTASATSFASCSMLPVDYVNVGARIKSTWLLPVGSVSRQMAPGLSPLGFCLSEAFLDRWSPLRALRVTSHLGSCAAAC